MEMEKVISKLEEIVDDHAKITVGIMLRRFEDLQLPKEQSLSFEQIKALYSNLVKNTTYEQARFLKKIIKATFSIGKIIFE